MDILSFQGTPLCQSMGFPKDWEDLLKELADHHHHMEEELAQQQWEEMQCVGLTLGDPPFKKEVLFHREEIWQNLESLRAILGKAHSLFRAEAAEGSYVSLVLRRGCGLWELLSRPVPPKKKSLPKPCMDCFDEHSTSLPPSDNFRIYRISSSPLLGRECKLWRPSPAW